MSRKSLMSNLITTVVLAVWLNAQQTEAASFFQPCRASDPALEACLKKAAQNALPTFIKGFPEMKILPSDPLSIDDVIEKLPAIQMNFTNTKVSGLSGLKFNNVKIDMANKKMYIDLVSNVVMDSIYGLEGRLLILPISGNGKSKITVKNMVIHYQFDYDTVKGKGGKDYWKVIKYQPTVEPEKLSFDFDNLFNGNKELSDGVHRFANENWKDIFAELGTPIVAKLTQKIASQITKFFNNVPVEELILP